MAETGEGEGEEQEQRSLEEEEQAAGADIAMEDEIGEQRREIENLGFEIFGEEEDFGDRVGLYSVCCYLFRRK